MIGEMIEGRTGEATEGIKGVTASAIAIVTALLVIAPPPTATAMRSLAVMMMEVVGPLYLVGKLRAGHTKLTLFHFQLSQNSYHQCSWTRHCP